MARSSSAYNSPELWGGLECTINRVGDRFQDQLDLAGHYDRKNDLHCIAELGLSRLRYPILWERYAPVRHQPIDWTFAAQGLEDLATHRIEPIVGLVHHGSGPAYTNLLDPDFPAYLAEYAFEVINRFPQLNKFTPVNEPLTTARFSGLYGFWYPHHRDDRSFALMLLNQLKAVVLAMQAIRAVNPKAQLIQTEDLGKTHGTPALSGQVNFENDRRWLSFDILSGSFVPGHPLWQWFTETLGIDEKQLFFFADHVCSPDVLGLNYYVTSERWLDEDLTRYPASTHGGNDRQSYADTEVVRVDPLLRQGIEALAGECWERYRIPLAFTEVHLHCTREEQMRWWSESWQAAVSLCRRGVPVAGVTAWSLLGAFDWDSLLTAAAGHYEPGVFVMEADRIRLTALGTTIVKKRLPEAASHPLLEVNGWWTGAQAPLDPQIHHHILLIGPYGPVAEALHRACMMRGITYRHQPFPTGPNIKSSKKPWAVLTFSEGKELFFSTDRLFIRSEPAALLWRIIDQVLDLVIDEATGHWRVDARYLPVPSGDQPLTAAAIIYEDHFQD